MNEVLLRSLTPSVLGILVRRGADFAAAEVARECARVVSGGGGGGGPGRGRP
ncbi:RNA polymerase subunit sigma-24, partial [Streptomyces mirabilis]